MLSIPQNCFRKIKRPFLLLEVLIALALVALTLLPIVATPLLLTRAEKEFQEKVEGRVVIQNSFAEIYRLLYENRIDFNNLLIEQERTLPPQNGFSINYLLKKPQIKKEKESPRFLLFPVEITVKRGKGSSISETFHLFVEKRSHD